MNRNMFSGLFMFSGEYNSRSTHVTTSIAVDPVKFMPYARHQTVTNARKFVNDFCLAARAQQIQSIFQCLLTAQVT